MDGSAAPSEGDVAVRTAQASVGRPADVARTLKAALGDGPFALVTLFISPAANVQGVATAVTEAFPGAEVIGCTTAGELAAEGYVDGCIVAAGLPAAHFDVEVAVVEGLANHDAQRLTADVMKAGADLDRRRPDWEREFGFLMIDGLSLREDQVASTLSAALGPVPFFGGSAGDALDFGETLVIRGDRVWRDAAVFARVRTDCPVRIFKIDHLTPTDEKMVVTGADSARRIVTEINAEPAAKEYARVLGKDPEQLSPFTFAAHPLLVKIGGQNHVRSIQQVLPNGDLVFFSAIEEGIVLTLAEASDMAGHLEDAMTDLSRIERPAAVIACDCILRRLEAEQVQATQAVSRVLSTHGVVGFNTYGEQVNGAHVNQTLTGIAIYPPSAPGLAQ